MLAACRSADPDLFFPVSSTEKSREQTAEAKAVCARDSREYRRPGEHPARSVRPAAPIHDRSSVFPLPGGADTTVTGPGAPSRSSAAGQGWSPTRAIARVSGTPSISRLVIVAARAPRVPFDRSLSAMA
ncbi:MAG TPA: WhiB family transcriptional regulator, partial [Streptosporangiaceae bacterium]|nr:WhiB family transcriptional regulator [Streptosporangiaceae bacterium]